MSRTRTPSTNASGVPTATDQLEADIERHRASLATTVGKLQAHLDVKARATSRMTELRGQATTDEGRPRPEVLAAAAVVVLVVAGLVALRRRH